MFVSLTMKSKNVKTGEIPVSTTESASCPHTCPMRETDCYARFGPLGMHWRKVGEGMRGDNWTGFCRRVMRFDVGQLWRHNQAGDLPQRADGRIHSRKLAQLSRVCAKRLLRGWTYTHYDPTDSHNAKAIAETNARGGLTINLSADSMADADSYKSLGIGPVVVVLPEDTPHRGNRTPAGHPITICPAQTNESMSCEQCKLCQKRDRIVIVGFLAHGTAKKRLSASLA